MTKARDIADSDLGSLTVDTDTLVVDETNNRVGIGTSSPSSALDVQGDVGVSGGIYLGGTGSANKLDDYEEGTWTGVVKDNTGTGSTSATGYYTKVGDVVHISMNVSNIDTSGMIVGSDIGINGLPFLADTSKVNRGSCNFERLDYTTSRADATWFTATARGVRVEFPVNSPGGNSQSLEAGELRSDSKSGLSFSVTYHTNQ